MSGFTPPNWRPFVEVRNELGSAKLGSLLSAGTVRAFYVNVWGDQVWMSASDWRRKTGVEAMQRGLAFSRRMARADGFTPQTREDTWPLFILAETLPAHPSPLPPANDARPTWWPTTNQNLTEWVVAPETTTEADRRLKERGRAFSESACCEAMEEMWREAGRSASEGSVARIRRRERA
ncbi:MAG: hypothetical protein RJA14_1336 [Pseudomonadota bacterium]